MLLTVLIPYDSFSGQFERNSNKVLGTGTGIAGSLVRNTSFIDS